MSEQNQDLILQNLTPEENDLLLAFKASGKIPLGPSLSAALLPLFVNNYSFRQIQQQNKTYELGALIDLAVRYNWFNQRDRYVEELHASTLGRMKNTQMESANFIADVMAATHKKYGTAIKKYLQSGNQEDLEGFDINNITSYSRSIEALMKITGQDTKKIKLEGNVSSNTPTTDPTQNPLTSQQSAEILKILVGSKELK